MRLLKSLMILWQRNPNIKVTLQNQSKYPDLQSKINQTIASPKDLPTITQAYPNWLWNAKQHKIKFL
ncbi:hypothetical protein MGH68_06145 [Erysipelothrix sp. D19-032]